MRSLRDDEASVFQVFEALLAAVLVTGAIGLFVALREDTPPVAPTDTGGNSAIDALAVLQGAEPNNKTDILYDMVVNGIMLNQPANYTAGKAALEALIPNGSSYTLRLNNGYGSLLLIDESDGVAPRDSNFSQAYLAFGAKWDVSTTGNPEIYYPGGELKANAKQLLDCVRSPKIGGTNTERKYLGTGALWSSLWADDGDSTTDRIPLGLPFGRWSPCPGNGNGQGNAQGLSFLVTRPDGVMPAQPMYSVQLVVWRG